VERPKKKKRPGGKGIGGTGLAINGVDEVVERVREFVVAGQGGRGEDVGNLINRTTNSIIALSHPTMNGSPNTSITSSNNPSLKSRPDYQVSITTFPMTTAADRTCRAVDKNDHWTLPLSA
jgi:hypothetical protein